MTIDARVIDDAAPFTDLTEVERELVASLVGQDVEATDDISVETDDVTVDTDDPDSYPPGRVLRADLLRWALTTPAPGRPVPGLIVGVALIPDVIDLDEHELVRSVTLLGVCAPQGLSAHGSTMRSLRVSKSTFSEVDLTHARIHGTLLLDGSTIDGTVYLGSATIDERLVVQGTTMETLHAFHVAVKDITDLGPALEVRRRTNFNSAALDELRITRSTLGLHGEPANGSRSGAAVVMTNAVVTHDLELDHVQLLGGVRGVGLTVGGDVTVDGCFAVPPMVDAESDDPIFASFVFDRARFGGSVFFGGSAVVGRVRLPGASVEHDLDFESTCWIGTVREALALLQLDAGLADIEGDAEEGTEDDGDGGGVDDDDLDDQVPGGLDGARLRVAGALRWTGITSSALTELDLLQAHASKFRCARGSWPLPGRLEVGGFTYDDLMEEPAGADDGIEWLDRQAHERALKPQPWKQFATVLANRGQDADARRVLRAFEQRRARAPETPPLRRIGLRVLDATTGSGYRLDFLLYWIVGIVVVGAVIFGMADALGHVVATEQDAGTFNPLVFSIDAFLPVVDLGFGSVWRVGDFSGSGTWFATYHLVHVLLGWLITTLAIVGVTAAARR